MAIQVKLEAFEGPLDLLLHLIEKNKIDIYNIPIAEITDQYLELVRSLQTDDMDLASEFMVMAATLIDIKCRMLLPKEETEEGEEEDPREELVRRLLEYKKTLLLSGLLKEQMEDTGNVLTRKQELPKEVEKYRPPVDMDELLMGVTLQKLSAIYEEACRRFEDKIDKNRSGFRSIEKEKLSVSDSMNTVQKRVIKERKISFRSLIEEQTSKNGLIVTFLAILELIHYNVIEVVQNETFGEIMIESKEPEGSEITSFDNIDSEM